jgi:hypothetical protein
MMCILKCISVYIYIYILPFVYISDFSVWYWSGIKWQEVFTDSGLKLKWSYIQYSIRRGLDAQKKISYFPFTVAAAHKL